jgi:hypothetical protein
VGAGGVESFELDASDAVPGDGLEQLAAGCEVPVHRDPSDVGTRRDGLDTRCAVAGELDLGPAGVKDALPRGGGGLGSLAKSVLPSRHDSP